MENVLTFLGLQRIRVVVILLLNLCLYFGVAACLKLALVDRVRPSLSCLLDTKKATLDILGRGPGSAVGELRFLRTKNLFERGEPGREMLFGALEKCVEIAQKLWPDDLLWQHNFLLLFHRLVLLRRGDCRALRIFEGSKRVSLRITGLPISNCHLPRTVSSAARTPFAATSETCTLVLVTDLDGWFTTFVSAPELDAPTLSAVMLWSYLACLQA